MSGFKMGNPMNNVATKNTVRKLSGGKTPSFQGQSLGFQMKNPSSPNNYGENPAPTKFFKKLFRGAKKLAGNFIRGKGAFGLLNPLGAIGSRMGLFGRRRGGGILGAGGIMGARMMGMRNRMNAMRSRMHAMGQGQIGPPGMNTAGPEAVNRQAAIAQAAGDLPQNTPVTFKNPYKNKK